MHPHPHGAGPTGRRPADPGVHVTHEQLEQLEQQDPPSAPGVLRRRLLLAVALAAVVVIAATLLTWQALTRKSEAQQAAAAASRACRQVEGLGQKCATDPAEEQAAAPQAQVPAAPSAVKPLPGAPSSSRSSAGGTGSTTGPEQTAAQPGVPDEQVNPGSDLIVGLTVRGGRLEVSYSDGNVVDAGRIEGAPPAIVLIVPSPARVAPSSAPSVPMGAEPSDTATPPADPLPEETP